MWKPQKGWMIPKHDLCINCNNYVDPAFAGYIVWDPEKGEYRRQHAECHFREKQEMEEKSFSTPTQNGFNRVA